VVRSGIHFKLRRLLNACIEISADIISINLLLKKRAKQGTGVCCDTAAGNNALSECRGVVCHTDETGIIARSELW